MSTRRVNDNDLETFLFEFSNTLCCYYDWISLGVRTKVSYFGLGRRLSGLIESPGAESVGTNDRRLESPLLIIYRKLCARRSLSVTLGDGQRTILGNDELNIPEVQQP